MTVLEAVLALMIASGVIGASITASRLAIERVALAELDAEALLSAEDLASRVGRDLPLSEGHAEGTAQDFARWTLDVAAIGAPDEIPAAFAITADVTMVRAGVSAHGSVATLRLQWPRR